MVVNATTAPLLVQKLGITALPSERLRLLKLVYEQLVWVSTDASHPRAVIENLKVMLADVMHHIEAHAKPTIKKATSWGVRGTVMPAHEDNGIQRGDSAMGMTCTNSSASSSFFGNKSTQTTSMSVPEVLKNGASDSKDLVKKIRKAESYYRRMTPAQLKLLGDLPENLLGKVDGMIDLLNQGYPVDWGMAKVVNKAFLGLVTKYYAKLMTKGDIRPGSPEADALFTSVRLASGLNHIDLIDFCVVEQHLATADKMLDKVVASRASAGWLRWAAIDEEQKEQEIDMEALRSSYNSDDLEDEGDASKMTRKKSNKGIKRKSTSLRIVQSAYFNFGITTVILANTIHICIAEARGDGDPVVAHVIEGVFSFIYIIEFLLKVAAKKQLYFKEARTLFEFTLVIFSILGIILSVANNVRNASDSEARFVRIIRIFRTLRFLRMVRLFHSGLGLDKDVKPETRKHLHRILTLTCFSHAHLHAQTSLVHYFGVNGKIDDPEEQEIARCILQSQLTVYRAIALTAKAETSLDAALIRELEFWEMKKNIVENLTSFITNANRDGAINVREAESILHPLHHEVSVCLRALNDYTLGKAPSTASGYEVVKEEQRRLSTQSRARASLADPAPPTRISPHAPDSSPAVMQSKIDEEDAAGDWVVDENVLLT